VKARAPAIQFYYRDWMSHPGLRMCSIAARGLWADLMCIMAEGSPYGYLKVGGKDILPATLARRVGESTADVERWLAELLEHEVCARDDTGTIYSPRMVRAEQLRQVRGAGGHKSQDNPNVPRKKRSGEDGGKDIHTPASKDTSRPSPAVASASALPSIHTPAVATFLEALPDDQNSQHWESIISGWQQGLGLEGGKAATADDVATGLTEYLAKADRDFAVIHVRSFVERARRNRIKGAARPATNGHNTEDASRLWHLLKARGIHHMTTNSELDHELASLVTEGTILNVKEFKTMLSKLDFKTLRKAEQDSFAVRHISERINGSLAKVLA
jgi:hypothetical protein